MDDSSHSNRPAPTVIVIPSEQDNSSTTTDNLKPQRLSNDSSVNIKSIASLIESIITDAVDNEPSTAVSNNVCFTYTHSTCLYA
jgi:hypothetical protein